MVCERIFGECLTGYMAKLQSIFGIRLREGGSRVDGGPRMLVMGRGFDGFGLVRERVFRNLEFFWEGEGVLGELLGLGKEE